jgi:hypothetical protein
MVVWWFIAVRSQFTFQGSGKDSFVFVNKFPYLPLNLRRRVLDSSSLDIFSLYVELFNILGISTPWIPS